jgi:formamidopyrimidine-DNA glycosylase
MPELPEVETTMRGVAPYLLGTKVDQVILRCRQLRWPVPTELRDVLKGQEILSLSRRGKYILMGAESGTAIWHLGMSGTLRILQRQQPAAKHDHIDWELSSGFVLRYCDPRRFGSLHWTRSEPHQHKLLANLGVEPLSEQFNKAYLFKRVSGRRVAIKQLIMNSDIVVGVGNIYATEALFLAKIAPDRPAGAVSLKECSRLTASIKRVLNQAIKKGGTTLKDFVGGTGKPGYFTQQLKVYGRGGLPCVKCETPLHSMKIGSRASVFCNMCQT